MTIGEKVKGLATQVQDGVKTSSISLTTLFLRLMSGFFLGITLALIGQELAGYSIIGLIFGTAVVLGLFMRVTRTWRIGHLLIFDLVCILVAQLLRMYILLAP